MKSRIPVCFREFHCIGGRCKDSCCAGWEIDIDEASFQRYQLLEGSFGERLRASIATEEDGTHHYILNKERCPFLDENGLCQQILEQGEDILCEICHQHPRFYTILGEVRETGMGLACEEAARLLFASPEPLTLVEQGEGDGPNDPCYRFLLFCRERMFALAQDRSLSIHQRMSRLLAFAGMAQEALDWGEYTLLEIPQYGPELFPGQGSQWLPLLIELEPIDAEWTAALEDTLAAAQYPELMEACAEDLSHREWEYEHLLYYLLFRYVMQAYEDRDLLYHVKTAVFGVLVVEQLDFGRWLRNQKRFTSEDRRDIARIFSKEIEYDPEIIDGLDEALEGLEGLE